MKLVIVESPNKCKKIQQYLGKGFEVQATAGHFRDLPEKELGVDLASFDPTYVVDSEKKAVVSKLKAAAEKADEVLLATDADREGEAISWHVAQTLRLKSPKRIRFTEITEKALKAAVANATTIDQHLVDAQQARRVLDRLVGFQVSPLLRPLGKNHSAGRVQSATLHLVVEREKQREAFKVEPYWVLTVRYTNGLVATYVGTKRDATDLGKRAPSILSLNLKSEAAANSILEQAKGPHSVHSVETEPVERKPKAPFTTSTLQQAASVQLGLKPDRTMALAQSLFEKGAITYHRTDSVALSEDAVAMARAFIEKDYPEALPATAPKYTSKGAAQEAHEAIRPTALEPQVPDDVTTEERPLYELIRKRFIACQCAPARLEQTTVTTESGETLWRARGSVVKFPSFLRYLDADEDADPSGNKDESPRIPHVRVGDALEVAKLEVKRKQTTPPPRFTEAGLIKEMERVGIGRPSTYAATIKVLWAREYIAEEKKYLYPTARGRGVDEVLERAFDDLVKADYTAQMETRLDEVAGGDRRWKNELRDWYSGFSPKLEAAGGIIANTLKERPQLAAAAEADAVKPTGKPCPRCSSELMLRPGKKGPFLACSAYPKCTYTADPSAKSSDALCMRCKGSTEELSGKNGPYLRCLDANCGYTGPFDAKLADVVCPKCKHDMESVPGKHGRYARCLKKGCDGTADLSETVAEPCPVCAAPMKDKGDFLGCSKYPACKGTWDKKALVKARKANRACPKCGKLLVDKKGPKGPFVGCSGYPVCTHIDRAA